MYKRLLRPFLFSLDPEKAHHLVMQGGKALNALRLNKCVQKLYLYEHPSLEQNCFGMKFKNPVGLAAGSDKDCQAQEFLAALGFGFLESVSFVYEPQPGNPKPRLFRLPNDQALINRLGFPTIGAEKLVERVRNASKTVRDQGVIFAVNFGKSKNVPLEDAVADYIKSFNIMKDLVNFMVINVSSPNTPGLRDLQEKSRLTAILQGLQNENTKKIPILVKVAPDLTIPELDDILECAEQNNIQGIVATNSTKARNGLVTKIEQEGGLSGKPLFPKSLEFVRHIRRRFQGKIKIIGLGGIFNSEDAVKMFEGGADLIEMYAGLIYEGPSAAYNIKRGLVKHLKIKGMSSIKELVGSANLP